MKDPADTVAKVIEPYRKAATEIGKEHRVLATRWTVLADGPEQAWQALSSMRGLRAPGRLEATDPAELRFRADEMDRAEVLNSYTVVPDAAGLIAAYHPLVTDVGADLVSIQVMSADPMAAIKMIGKDVLPELRALAAEVREKPPTRVSNGPLLRPSRKLPPAPRADRDRVGYPTDRPVRGRWGSRQGPAVTASRPPAA